MIRNERDLVQSVSRAVDILELVARIPGELGVSEIGRRLGLHKATAHRLVSTLAARGLVERDAVTDKYRPGFGAVRLAATAASGLDLVRQARPVLASLAQETGETVNLAVLDSDQVMNIDQVSAAHSLVSVSWVGRRTPLHCTSNGKVLLAHLPPDATDRLLVGPLERLTPKTVVDPNVLRAQLARARVLGYAYTTGELEVGLNAVAAPVRDATGEVVAAISVAGPAYRVTAARIPRLGASAKAAAEEISRRMGHVERREHVGSDRE